MVELQLHGVRAYAYSGAHAIDPALPAVVFIHGAGMDHTVWTLPARYFIRHGCTVLAVDLPGHGRSAGPPLTRIEAMADWIVALLDATGIGQAALAGHSMGSLVALDVAVRHPDRVRALALLGTALPMAVSPALLDAAGRNDHAALDMLTIWGHSRHAQIGGNETPGMWMLGGTLRLFERAAPGVIHTDLAACNAYAARPAGPACPTLLILGSRDIMTPPRSTRAITDGAPNVRKVVLPGSGHSMLAESPDAVLDALIEIV